MYLIVTAGNNIGEPDGKRMIPNVLIKKWLRV